ncbi:MAG: glycosyltransferase, partial [Actinomycetota bacterium]|nr:glycosyltransferase [Actinomycetota bacterium]
LLAAASKHEVWAITNPSAVAGLRRALPDNDVTRRMHLHPLEFGVTGDLFEHLSMVGFQRYYDAWQRQAARLARELDASVGFDVVHHATLSSYWTRAGVASLDVPLVWGPVGGAVNAPLRLLPELGARGVLEEVARASSRPILARLPPARRARRRASFTFAQNPETATKVSPHAEVSILPNALATKVDAISSMQRRTSEILFVGRLLPWKAPTLAVRALALLENDDASLHLCGDGPERMRVERLAATLGVRDRVIFEGWLPRPQLLDRLARAGTLIHPSVHEEGGMCVAEALGLGTPAVCLRRGGPAEITKDWPWDLSACVPPTTRELTVRRMAAAIDGFLDSPPPVLQSPMLPRRSYEAEILHAYNVAVDRSRNRK